jgi:hypothetical protein
VACSAVCKVKALWKTRVKEAAAAVDTHEILTNLSVYSLNIELYRQNN